MIELLITFALVQLDTQATKEVRCLLAQDEIQSNMVITGIMLRGDGCMNGNNRQMYFYAKNLLMRHSIWYELH